MDIAAHQRRRYSAGPYSEQRRAGPQVQREWHAGRASNFWLYSSGAAAHAGGKLNGSQMVARTNEAITAIQAAKIVFPKVARAGSLFLGGTSLAEIVAELRGLKSSQSWSCQPALNEITELIREGVQS